MSATTSCLQKMMRAGIYIKMQSSLHNNDNYYIDPCHSKFD